MTVHSRVLLLKLYVWRCQWQDDRLHISLRISTLEGKKSTREDVQEFNPVTLAALDEIDWPDDSRVMESVSFIRELLAS